MKMNSSTDVRIIRKEQSMKRAYLAVASLLILGFTTSHSETAREIIKKSENNLRANSSLMTFSMTIVKPEWSRSIKMKAWSLEPDFALIYVMEPARDKGSTTLKRKNEVWNWIPAAQKVIKIPPSMMLQSWMGSDFTNDDLVREASVIDDYTHRLLGSQKIDKYDAWKIESIPLPSAGIVWGKIISFISKGDYLQICAEYYDEDGTLVKVFKGSQEKTFGDRKILSHWEMIPTDKPNNKTILEYLDAKFNIDIQPAFFSEQNMKRVR